MKRLIAIVGIFILVNSRISHLSAQTCWSEVWSDEFSGTSLNTTNWNYDLGTGCPGLCGWGNNEKQNYTNDAQNISVSGGLLTITARYSLNNGGPGYNFSSAKIHTRNKHHWKYGRMEARMKLAAGTGVWPAFWMLPQSSPYGGWPTSGEIDIMEYRGDLTTKIDGTLHYGNPNPQNQWDGSPYTLSSGNFVDDFHVFAVEWEENAIRWYVDGVLFKTETKSPNTLNPASNNAVTWPWDQDFYFILNLAIGGWYSGNPNDNDIIGGNTSWTRSIQVDYVRVYTDLSGGALTGSISGKTSVVPNEMGVVYTIPATTDADYTWTVPSGVNFTGQGTNQITVDWGTSSGSISVVKAVGCGNANYSLPITMMPVPCGTMLEDFENIRFQDYGFINGQFTSKVANPASSVENTSPFCAQYIRNPSEQYDVLLIENPGLGNADLIKNNTKRFMFDVYSNGAGRIIEITLENSNVSTPSNYPTGRHSTYRATTTKANEWETLTFTLVASPDASVNGNDVNLLVMLFMPNTYTDNTFYFDNILLDEGLSAPTVSGVSTVCNNQTGVNFSTTNTSGNTYAWTVPTGATITSGQGTNAILVDFGTAFGTISVTRSNGSGCTSIAGTKTITNSNCTSVNSYNSAQSVSVYPNPVAENLSIQFSELNSNNSVEVKIMESTGKIISTERYNISASNLIDVSVSDLKTGYYLIQLSNEQVNSVKSFYKK